MKILCKIMQISRSTYYSWCSNGSFVPREETLLKDKVRVIFKKSKNTYGSRRIVKSLINEGVKIGRFKIRKIMERLGLEARYPKKYKTTTDSNHKLGIVPNLLTRL